MKRLVLATPAKVNLFLDVLGRRPDGYHDLRSLVVPVSVYDRLTFETCASGIALCAPSQVRLAGLPWPLPLGRSRDNLVARAARLLQSTTGHRGGVRIRLDKRIPIAGGLGGGSADAAAALLGLNRLWDTRLSRDTLMALGARLGSDIPALIHGGAVRMEGRGECVTALPRRVGTPLWMVLVYPGFGVATGDIYARYTLNAGRRPARGRCDAMAAALAAGDVRGVARRLFNALQATVFAKYPLLEILKKELEKAGALGVVLSGSGSTVLALVRDGAQGRAVAARLRTALGLPLWVRVARATGATRRLPVAK